MNTLAKHRPITAVPGLQGSAEQIDALNTAIILGVSMALIELSKTERAVQSFREELQKFNCDRQFNTQMLEKWLVHLARDQENLRIARSALHFLYSVEITLIEVTL